MADPNPDTRSDNNGDPIPIPTEQTPLLLNHQNHQQQSQEQEDSEESRKDELSETLERLERFLTFLGFKQSCFSSFALSWTAFFVVGVLPPIVVLESSECLRCSKFQIKEFEIEIVASQACLAAVSLLCLSHNLRKYGVRRFLFVDRHNGHEFRLRDDYVKQISNSFRLLILWALPIFFLKTGREILRVLYSEREAGWSKVAILVALVISWSYVSTISLTASIMFHLVCNLQVIHFNEYGKMLGRDSDVLVFIEDHIRLRYHLSKISHRFRIFLVLQFLTVTASQFVTLLQITGYSGLITVINGGDFAVSSLVQVVGIIICLHAATRISHRAQNLASMAGQWHALVTCGSNDQHRGPQQVLTLEGARVLNSLVPNNSESVLESLDYASVPTQTQLASDMSSYHRRQAFVLYLQTNPGGITIFGWTVDRGLINTIFFIELTLITFLLGKTIVFTSS